MFSEGLAITRGFCVFLDVRLVRAVGITAPCRVPTIARVGDRRRTRDGDLREATLRHTSGVILLRCRRFSLGTWHVSVGVPAVRGWSFHAQVPDKDISHRKSKLLVTSPHTKDPPRNKSQLAETSFERLRPSAPQSVLQNE